MCYGFVDLLISTQRLQVAEFSGLRVSNNGGEASFFDAIAAQITPKVADCNTDSVNSIDVNVHVTDDGFVKY